MADRTAAEIYGKIFDILATHYDESKGKIHPDAIEEIWNTMPNYDFDSYQLDCDDDSLVALGLAKWVSPEVLNEKYPDEGYREDDDTLIRLDDEIWDEV